MLPHLTVALGLAAATASAASGKGHTTRYWDCCKTSCAWSGKASVSEPVLTCDKKENPIVDANAQSGCDGGGAFACTNNAPWAVSDDLAYGFAATALTGGTESSWCCACYAITFTSGPVAGKKMVVQSTNTGGDLSDNHFDLMIPGGGLGIFDGCTAQFGMTLPGERYGGVSSRSQCDSMPELLKDGCQWRFDWFLNADNPDIEFEQVQCPAEIVAVSGCRRDDDASFPAFSGGGGGGGTSPKPSMSTKKASTTVAPAASSSTKAPAQVETTPSPAETKAAETGSSEQPPVQEEQQQDESKSTSSKASAAVPTTTASAPVSSSTSAARVALWGQCDSKAAWAKALKCEKGSKCVYVNDWYSQCQPKKSCS